MDELRRDRLVVLYGPRGEIRILPDVDIEVAQDLPGEEGFLRIKHQRLIPQPRATPKVIRARQKIPTTPPHLAYTKEIFLGHILGFEG